jgi:glycosyltransferase involved in cell wall biosynthesis
MILSDITPVILTYNEGPNVGRCLERLNWAQRVVVVDSGSTDETAELVAQAGNALLLVRRFDDHTTQWNYGVDAVLTRWVLSLDADYMITEAFVEELRGLELSDEVDACYVPFVYCVYGKPLRGSLYPPRAMLFRKDRCRYVQDGHTQMLEVKGRTEMMKQCVEHDDRKPLSRWFASQDKYAALEAEKLCAAAPETLRVQDKLRLKMIYAPVVTLIYTLLVRGVIWDGWRGWFYAFQRVTAEVMLSLRLLEKKVR